MTLIATVVTAIVFLAGFTSLRIHYRLNAKKRALEGVVESVTTTPGYADTLRALEDRVQEAGRMDARARFYRDVVGRKRWGPAWHVAAIRLDEGMHNPALGERDLRPVRASLRSEGYAGCGYRGDVLPPDPLPLGPRSPGPNKPCLPLSDTVSGTIMLALTVLLLLVATMVWPQFNELMATERAVSLLVSVIVVVVAFLDVCSVEGELEGMASAVELPTPTPTWWQRTTAQDDDPDTEPGRAALVMLGHADDAIDLPLRTDQAVEHLESAARLLPEWSTPRALLAYQGWQRSGYSLRDPQDRVQSDANVSDASETRRTADLDARIADIERALGHAHAAVALNPLDPGCRLLLAALEIDLLAYLIDHRSNDGKVGDVFEGLGPAHQPELGQLVEPLPLSQVVGGAAYDRSGDRDDPTRPRRWRFSRVLQHAKQASVAVERRWGKQRMYRSATGMLTELDFASVNFQLGRAYVLNSCVDPASPVTRGNAQAGRKCLRRTLRTLRGIQRAFGSVSPHEAEYHMMHGLPPGRALNGLQPRVLCLPGQCSGELSRAFCEILAWRGAAAAAFYNGSTDLDGMTLWSHRELARSVGSDCRP